MNQAEFCRASGMSDTWVRPVENGAATSVPRRSTLHKLDVALRLPAGTLAHLVDEGGDLPEVTMATDQDRRIAQLEETVADLVARLNQSSDRPKFNNDPEGGA